MSLRSREHGAQGAGEGRDRGEGPHRDGDPVDPPRVVELDALEFLQGDSSDDGTATGRLGTPNDIANAAAFLLGPDAAFMTGTDLLVDRGVVGAVRSGFVSLPQD